MVSVGGLASGLDTNAIIAQLVEVERRPIRLLEANIAELQQVQATFTSLSTRFAGLRSAGFDLSLSNLDQPSISQSDESSVAISANSTASPGSHTLAVQQLATASRVASQGFADSDTTPIASGAGTFGVRVGSAGAQISVAVTATTTMTDLANAINAADGDVTASVISDGTNELSSRLVLTSSVTGAGNDIQVVSSNVDLDFANNRVEVASADTDNAGTYTGTVASSGTYTGSDNKTFMLEIVGAGAAGAATYRVSDDGGQTWTGPFTTSTSAATLGANTEGVEVAFSAGGTLTAGDRFYVDVSTPTLATAKDAVFTLDGITQTRSSNNVTDALAGVTLSLIDTTSTNVAFAVVEDDGRVVEAVEGFVEAYNELFTAIRSEQTFDAETFEAGILLGDRTANAILSQLRTTLSRSVSNTGGPYETLASLGLTSSITGGLSLDASQLREALDEDREAVLRVLASAEQTSNSSLSVISRPTEQADGEYSVSVTTAPEVARVAAGGAQADTLGAAETLSFSYSANQTDASPTSTNFSVALQAGDTLGQVINRLNSAFATQGVLLRAYSDGGTLTIDSTEYGADLYFSVVSDVASGANTTRIGTTLVDDAGVDIVGSINGAASTGVGSRLEVNSGSDLEGLALNYAGTSTGLVGTVTISTGAGALFVDTVNSLNTGSESVVGTRTSSIQDQIDQLEERIADREEQVARTQTRLEEQFAALEVQLAGLQSQADFLNNQLAQLSSLNVNQRSS